MKRKQQRKRHVGAREKVHANKKTIHERFVELTGNVCMVDYADEGEWARHKAAIPENTASTYAEYVRLRDQKFEEYKRNGIKVIRNVVLFDDLVRFCRERELAVNSASRKLFSAMSPLIAETGLAKIILTRTEQDVDELLAKGEVRRNDSEARE